MKIGTVREMLLRMDCHELNEWAAMFRIHRLGEEYADDRAGTIAAAAANAGRLSAQAQGAKLSGSAYSANDFFPKTRERPGREALTAKMNAWAIGMGANLGG